MIGFLEGPLVARCPTRAVIEGLCAWCEEHHKSWCILVCRALPGPPQEHGIEIMPLWDLLTRFPKKEIRGGCRPAEARDWPRGTSRRSRCSPCGRHGHGKKP